MNNKSKKTETAPYANKSLLFAIEDVAKLLRTEVKKKRPIFKKLTNERLSSLSPSDFANNIEQIAKLLRTQIHAFPKKMRRWTLVKKTSKPSK